MPKSLGELRREARSAGIKNPHSLKKHELKRMLSVTRNKCGEKEFEHRCLANDMSILLQPGKLGLSREADGDLYRCFSIASRVLQLAAGSKEMLLTQNPGNLLACNQLENNIRLDNPNTKPGSESFLMKFVDAICSVDANSSLLELHAKLEGHPEVQRRTILDEMMNMNIDSA